VSPTQVIVVGAPPRARCVATELLASGYTDIVAVQGDITASVFDGATDTWTLITGDGESYRAPVIVAAGWQPYVPWVPEIPGRNAFRGTTFHAAQWDTDFDPTGKHIAVIGADSVAGHYLGQLSGAAASVTVFAHAPRRIVAELPLPVTRVKRWLHRHARAALGRHEFGPALVASPISAITPSGIHTSDGVEHGCDAIIYGTGFTVRDQASGLVGAGGVTIEQAWEDGMEPFLGVAVRGFPNYFWIGGPDVDAQTAYVAECLALMRRSASTRIEVLRSSLQVFNERAHLGPAAPFRAASAFDLSAAAPLHDETYDGLATLTVDGIAVGVRARLAGRLDPIDGHYHWQGTLSGSPGQPQPNEVLRQIRTAMLTVGEHTAVARIVEQTPWGTHSVAGVGAPPYRMTQS
jgi:hypothetical protein